MYALRKQLWLAKEGLPGYTVKCKQQAYKTSVTFGGMLWGVNEGAVCACTRTTTDSLGKAL